MRDQRGFSVLELCTVIFILGIITTFAIPAFTQFLMREERRMVLDRLQGAIEYAKQEAFVQNKTITICGSINHRTCQTDDWSAGFIILNSKELLYVFPKLRYGKLSFDQFGKHLSIAGDGTTINNGTFTYCPKNGDRQEADALIVNNTSRTYRPTQKNHQGIWLKNVGTPKEEALKCQ